MIANAAYTQTKTVSSGYAHEAKELVSTAPFSTCDQLNETCSAKDGETMRKREREGEIREGVLGTIVSRTIALL